MRTVSLPSGEAVPAFGMGTWQMGDSRALRAQEIRTLQYGLDHGAALIDTAEMYGEGRAEELVGEALGGRRDAAFIVTKVYPHNASRTGVVAACERSLARLKCERIDLYLLHWRGSVALGETLEAFVKLQRAGKIRHYGVSNLDLTDMQELEPLPGGAAVATNQLLYNLGRRGIEWELLPWLRERHIPVMAYSPIEQAKLTRHPGLERFATGRGMTASQVALAWLLQKGDIVAIPKTSSPERLRENLRALECTLTTEDLAGLDRLFPPPKRARRLEMI